MNISISSVMEQEKAPFQFLIEPAGGPLGMAAGQRGVADFPGGCEQTGGDAKFHRRGNALGWDGHGGILDFGFWILDGPGRGGGFDFDFDSDFDSDGNFSEPPHFPHALHG
jgi:hypothetical protein